MQANQHAVNGTQTGHTFECQQSAAARSKKQALKRQLECRRLLEEKWEERRLQRELREFDFS